MINDPSSDTASFDDVLDAMQRLEGIAVRTPLMRNDYLDQIAGVPVWIKPECLQRTGSFKMRGAWNRISRIPEGNQASGVVAFSSGNHAQGVAESARILGMPATIVMPSDAPSKKLEATKMRGAVVRLYDRQNESREAIGEEIAAQTGATLIKPYDDALVIAGQGTAALEAVRDVAERDASFGAVLCPASGGGLLAGTSLVMREMSPSTKVFVAEPDGHDDHVQSLRAGKIVANAPGFRSIADALMAPQPGNLTFPINRQCVAGGVTVSDEQILSAMAFAFQHLKLVLEPGGAVSLAALMLNREMFADMRSVLIVLSGGNVDPEMFSRALASQA